MSIDRTHPYKDLGRSLIIFKSIKGSPKPESENHWPSVTPGA